MGMPDTIQRKVSMGGRMKLYFLDKYGWPVERIDHQPILNFLRLLIHTRRISRRCLNIEKYNHDIFVPGCHRRSKEIDHE